MIFDQLSRRFRVYPIEGGRGVFQDLRGYGNIRMPSPFKTENSTGWTFERGRSRVLLAREAKNPTGWTFGRGRSQILSWLAG